MTFKNILPFENYVSTTKLSVDEAINRITNNIEEKQTFRVTVFRPTYTKPYTGQISGSSFKINRNINYRNSFLPVIIGQISKHQEITRIQIKMRPDTLVLIFISFWLGVVGLACLAIILAGFFRFEQILNNGFSPLVFMPFGMFAFGYSLTYFGFKFESKKSKAFLEKLLESDEIVNH